jgi:hypothetical protein
VNFHPRNLFLSVLRALHAESWLDADTGTDELETAKANARALLRANPVATAAAPIGYLWWSAESAIEATQWARECLERGAHSVDCRASVGGQVDVIIGIARDSNADHVAGYPIDASEWMEPIHREHIRALCDKIKAGYAAEKSSFDDGQIQLLIELGDCADDIRALAQE